MGDSKRPMGRREMMEARKNKTKTNANLLFNPVKNRKRVYKLPFFEHKFKQYITKKYDMNMSVMERRQFDTITLDNELEVLLVTDTDPKATHAACAMAVNAGYFSDPPEMPGLAHLLEHMMFLGGNEKFESGELARFVSSVGGTHNAYTVAEETNYHFDVPFSKAVYEAALDRFTSSFVKPTFPEDGIRKESEVVDNEYAKNIGDPMRSILELLRGNSNPAHPFSKFSCGNYNTLHEVPAEKKLDIPNFLDEFFHKHYSANRMKAVLIAPLPIDELKKIAKKYFSKIENFKSKPLLFYGSPYTEKENFTRFDIITHKDTNELLLSFPLENLTNFHRELPHSYLCDALSSRAPGSLVDYLEEKGWGDSVSAFPMQCAHECVLFWIKINCTEEGIWDHVEDIIHAFFIYVSKLYHTGLNDDFIDNVADLVCKNHAQRVDTYAYRFGQTVVSHMLVTSKEHYITHGSVTYEYNHETYLRVCEALKPEKMTVVVSHKGAEAVADMQEKYYKSHYTKTKLDPKLLERFNSVDPEVRFEVPKTVKEKERKNFRPFKFERPKPCDVSKLKNLPETLKKNSIIKGGTQFFIYINKPKDKGLDKGKKDKKKEEKATEPPPTDDNNDDETPAPPPGEVQVMKDCCIADKLQGVDVIRVKDCADGEDEDDVPLGTIGGSKKKKAKGFMERGVISSGAPKAKPKKKKEIKMNNGNIKGVRDDLETTNEIDKEGFAFASKEVGKLYELNAKMFFKPPLPDMYRPPLLIKANEKSLLFLKQNVPMSRDNFTTEICVDIFIYPKFLTEYNASPRDRALFTFYMNLVNTSLSRYRKKMKYEFNVKFSIGSTTESIAISIKGHDQKVYDICREIVDEMKRTHNFKWSRFERYKKALLSGNNSIKREPRKVCSSHLNFFTIEPKWMYKDMDDAIKNVKLRDCQKFAEKVFHGCNMQVVVVGNATPPQAIQMFDLLENSLKSADNNRVLYNEFPITKRTILPKNVEAFYHEFTKDIFKDKVYEFKTYHEDNNSGYHCMLQVIDMTPRKKAILSLLGTLIDSPCNDRIRTEERVGYLIHSTARTGSITASLEFMFQSNTFGPFSMDEKLERFLVDYLPQLEKYTPGELIKAKNGIAAPAMKPPASVPQESDYWSGFVAGGSYEFDSVHYFVNELWKVTLEEVVEFYKSYILPGAPERRKLVVGVTCGPHTEVDEKSLLLKQEEENVLIIKDPYDFKYSLELAYRK